MRGWSVVPWRTWAVFAAIGGGALIFFFLRAATAPEGAAATTSQDGRLDHLERRMQRLERVDRSGQRARGAATQHRPPTNAPNGNTPEDIGGSPAREADGSPPRPTAEEQLADRLALLDDAFQEGTPAPALERETWSKVQSALGKPEFATTTLASLACTATLCRIEALHDTEGEASRFCGEFGRQLGFPSRFWTRSVLDDGRILSLQFMAPEGHYVPRLRDKQEY